MLRETLLLVIGALLVLAIEIDIVWTSLGTHGGGPISGRFTTLLWKGAVRLHNYEHHRALSFAGSIIVTVLLIFWVTLLWIGWSCIFNAGPTAIVDSHTNQPAGMFDRIFFAAYTMSTMGNGDFRPNGAIWQIVTGVATLSGIGTVTLAITFIVNVLTAVVQKRTMAAYISDMGATPDRIIARSWTGMRFDSLTDHLIALTSLVHLYTEQHLAYPVLHFFHAESERMAATLRVAALNELLLLLAKGVAVEARLPPMVIQPLENAMDGFRTVIENEFVKPDPEPPPPPPLSYLSGYGIPTVPESTYLAAIEQERDSRRFFSAFVRDDGRKWERVYASFLIHHRDTESVTENTENPSP